MYLPTSYQSKVDEVKVNGFILVVKLICEYDIARLVRL